MDVHPAADMCCGCASLLTGVQAVSFLTLLYCVFTISLCSSKESIFLFGVSVPPLLQVLAGTWALFGIPLAINAGVGMLYRIEMSVRAFFYYHCASLLVGVVVPIWFIVSGAVCATVGSPNMQRVGSSFACGVVNAFSFFWLTLVGIVHAYLIYILWSAAEEIGERPFPELEKYREQLRRAEGLSPVKPEQLMFRSAPVAAPMFVLPAKVPTYAAAPVISYAAPVATYAAPAAAYGVRAPLIGTYASAAEPVATMGSIPMVSAPVVRTVSAAKPASYSPRSTNNIVVSPRSAATMVAKPAVRMSSATYPTQSYVLPAAGETVESRIRADSVMSFNPTPPVTQSPLAEAAPTTQVPTPGSGRLVEYAGTYGAVSDAAAPTEPVAAA